ncbi:hypothetical protein ABZX90_34360 [Streptomyces sp. NPDC002935]|uniref:hypothetical protein n=1 Tax=Streptomyces sp. NPDC002935 TaxID=3154545 RepID=UPI0033B759D9
MIDIRNIVILGDSLSDIGNKWTWPSGELGRLFGAMRVNETGRFSDGKNWTDHLVEWATGESLMWGNCDLSIRKSTDYRTLSRSSTLGISPWDGPAEMKAWRNFDDYIAAWKNPKSEPDPLPEIKYVNYATGGCIVTRDWTLAPKFGALTYLRGQVEDYVAQRAGGTFDGPTLHVVWIGLNDFVTVERPDYTPEKLRNLPPADNYEAWLDWSEKRPSELTNGVGVFPAVAEVQALVEMVNATFPDEKADNHFMVIDLPSVYHAIRFMKGIGEPAKVEQAEAIDPVVRRYNTMLESLVRNWPKGDDAPGPDNVHLVQMSKWMDYVSGNPTDWDLNVVAQAKGVPVFYNPGVPPQPTKDPVAREIRRAITTSDLAHPTEAVYEIMARYFVAELLDNGYTLGRLDQNTWAANTPFKNLPQKPLRR